MPKHLRTICQTFATIDSGSCENVIPGFNIRDIAAMRDVTGKAFVFAGGTSGIGQAAAIALAKRHATIAVLGRNRERGEESAVLLKQAGATEARWIRADLSTIAGIAAAAGDILSWRDTIHGLVHSAVSVDLHPPRRNLNVDGHEHIFALQYLARAGLNLKLLAALAASGDGRIIHIGANPPSFAKPNVDDPNFERRKWTILGALMSSQLFGFLHVQEATRRWRDNPVSVAIAAVGPTKTPSIKEQPFWVRALYALIATTPERSAANVVRYLLETSVEEANGGVFRDYKTYRSTPIAYDEEAAGRLWALTENLLNGRKV